MSIRIMQWVFERSATKGVARTVALALADHADHDGNCWPSWSRIARYANCGRSTVAEAVAEMARLGEIQIVSRAAAHKTNIYRFTAAAEGPEFGPSPVQNPDGGRSRIRTVTRPESGPEPSFEPSVEPSKDIAGSKPASFPAASYEQVETAFSEAYRAKKEAEGKPGAEWINTSIGAGRKAIRALFLAGVTPEEIIGRIPDYVRAADGRYKRYTLAAFVANFNDTGSGPADKREENRSMAADAHWGRR